jgi:ferredoxin
MKADQVFDQTEEDEVVIVLDAPSPARYDAVRAAVAVCPTSAIRLAE